MSNLTPFGVTIRKLRIDKNLKLFDVAEKIGVSSAFLSAIETGRKTIPDGFMVKVSRAMDLSAAEARELRKAVDRTRTEVRLDAKSAPERELIAAFARKLDDVPNELIEKLKKIVLKSIEGDIPFRRKRRGIFVPPLSTSTIRKRAEKIRAIFVAECQVKFPIIEVIECSIPKIDPEYIFDVRDKDYMGDDEGHVPINGNELILRADVYDGACKGNPRDLFTAAHEFAHYLMHRNISFARARDDNDKIYCDSEWQADSFAGTLMMSPQHAANFPNGEEMAKACGMSKHAGMVMWAKYVEEGIVR